MKHFGPLTLRNMTLKNRLVLPGLYLGLGEKGQCGTAFYLERARGGVGAVKMDATPVDLLVEDEAWGSPGDVEQLINVIGDFFNF